MANWLKGQKVDIERVLVSPFLRAEQTLDVVGECMNLPTGVDVLPELTPCGDIAHWTNPKGGYFISLYVMPGCAKRVAQLCKECGLTLTGAGSAYSLTTRTRRILTCVLAPTYPSLDEVGDRI